MIEAFAIKNYRSLKEIVAPLSSLNVVTGANGSGKSNLYKALKLLSETADGNLISALAQSGGLESIFWAGPEQLSREMIQGIAPIQGAYKKRKPTRLEFGFSGDEFSYSISLGLPPPDDSDNPEPTLFQFDPVIRRECIWVGSSYRPASCLVDRQGPIVKVREGRSWRVHADHLSTFDSILTELADPSSAPEIFRVREQIKRWRFYDQFRTDVDSPIRQSRIGTFTPVLDHEGHGLLAALRTIYEIGDREALAATIDDAFPGATISITKGEDNRFSLLFFQEGLLRPLKVSELSDGTLRYLLLVAALLTPRPPSLLVLNEPETSLHPDLLPALGRLIIKASEEGQVWVVSHASRLVETLEEHPECNSIFLDKQLGETCIPGQGILDKPLWKWAN